MEGDEDHINERKAMNTAREKKAQTNPAAVVKLEETANDPFAKVVHNAIGYLDSESSKANVAELEARQMKRSTAQITLLLLVSRKGTRGAPARALVDVTASAPFADVQVIIKRRCHLKAKRFQVFWLEPSGATVEIDTQQLYARALHTSWCALPLVLHVRDEERDNKLPVVPIPLTETGRTLFRRYDVSGNGGIGKYELKRRMIADLRIDRYIDCSELLLERWLEGEFKKIDGITQSIDQAVDGTSRDADRDGEISLAEFTEYITTIPRWNNLNPNLDPHPHPDLSPDSKPNPNRVRHHSPVRGGRTRTLEPTP